MGDVRPSVAEVFDVQAVPVQEIALMSMRLTDAALSQRSGASSSLDLGPSVESPSTMKLLETLDSGLATQERDSELGETSSSSKREVARMDAALEEAIARLDEAQRKKPDLSSFALEKYLREGFWLRTAAFAPREVVTRRHSTALITAAASAVVAAPPPSTERSLVLPELPRTALQPSALRTGLLPMRPLDDALSPRVAPAMLTARSCRERSGRRSNDSTDELLSYLPEKYQRMALQASAAVAPSSDCIRSARETTSNRAVPI
eukprot:TRINITY_DN66614_c0_g1_i1.p1 TRINITY_DN66614_c0_g1~~TRINITY_DN66614_c0_g1_i1.p1  ORF type:complete len:276 (+),score=48.27 TRINITY_DN66614_c0_g1_i1:40-828(+)